MADGVAVLQPDGSDVRGVVRFTERSNPYGYEGVTIQYRITGLTDGEHGFHIHRYGDLTDGCTSACEHFDPQTQLLESKLAEWVDALDLLTRGGGGFDTGQERVIYVGRSRSPYSEKQILKQISKISNQLSRRHHGGLDTRVRHFGDLGNITSSDGVAEGELFLPNGRLDTSRYGILGRMIIVHADRDDLGEGGDEESLKTGNAGKRLACGVIGLADPDTDNMTMDAEDEEFAAEDDYEATYGKEQAKIRRRLKNKLMGEATMGTKAGEWSARKSQELKRRYEAACERKGIKPYKGSKTSKQKDLSAWSKQGWRTASGRKSSVTGEPYFPAKAVKALKDKELYAKAKRQKAAATRAGKQRATYSKDIQAVVARYRAEDDHTIDDLDSDTLINRMDAIGVLMDEIVRKHGNSYEKAERDPTYLRLANQHNALARAYARREGFGAEDLTIEEPPMDIEEEAQARLEAIRQLQWGIRVIERMLREGNIDDAREFARITIEAMRQEEDAARDLGLDPDRFSAESDEDELYYIQLRPKFTIGRMGYVHHHRAFSNLEDAQSEARILSLEFPAKHRGVLGITKGKGYPYNFMLTKSSCKMCGADSENPCVCMIGPEVRPCSDKPIKKWQSDSVMYQPCPCSDVTDGFSAESDPVFAFRYMPESAYHKALEKGYMEPWGSHGATLATIDPTPTFHQTDGFYDGGHPLSDIYQIDLTGLQYRHHQVSATQGQVILIDGNIPVDQIQPLSFSYSNDGYRQGMFWEAESDPISQIAAGTNDALADFANSHDTDDGYYFAGGLIGGLLIAVAGNIISDRLQDWWRSRSA